jgi:hypothetical protein
MTKPLWKFKSHLGAGNHRRYVRDLALLAVEFLALEEPSASDPQLQAALARGMRKAVVAPSLIFFTVEHASAATVDVIHFWYGARRYPEFG